MGHEVNQVVFDGNRERESELIFVSKSLNVDDKIYSTRLKIVVVFVEISFISFLSIPNSGSNSEQ